MKVVVMEFECGAILELAGALKAKLGPRSRDEIDNVPENNNFMQKLSTLLPHTYFLNEWSTAVSYYKVCKHLIREDGSSTREIPWFKDASLEVFKLVSVSRFRVLIF